DWDDRIIEYCSKQFQMEYGLDPLEDIDAKADLRQRAERAKKELSAPTRKTTKIIINAHGKKLGVDLTREKFEELTSDLLERCNDCCKLVLEEAKLNWKQIDTVLLAGGATRMPMVQEMLKRISGKELHPELVNPDECVALGAAIQAKILGIRGDIEKGFTPTQEVMDKIGRVRVRDVTSHKLGIVVVKNGKNVVSEMIPKGTNVPCSSTKTFGTEVDNQPNVLLEIKEGESDDPALVPTIQEATLPIINPMPSGAPIDVTFEYSADGMLVVIGKDVTNNKNIRVEIKREGNLTREEVEQGAAFANKISVTG
nr:Hsp70 family protein [Bacteroidota bacterium]